MILFCIKFIWQDISVRYNAQHNGTFLENIFSG